MSTIYSIQGQAINDVESGTYTQLEPSDLGGRQRIAYFAWESTAATTADSVKLTRLPANSRVLGIYLNSEALGDTVDFGDADDDDRLVTALASSAYTGEVAMRTDTDAFTSATVDSVDIGYGYKYSAETDILLTPNGTLTAGKNLRGHITYVVD